MNYNAKIRQTMSPLKILTNKLAVIGLKPPETGGGGTCFLKACSHQFFGTPEFHQEMRLAGIDNMNSFPELYIETFSGNSWNHYIEEMSRPQTWCDNIIIQAVANSFNCIIHITDSTEGSPEKIITPSTTTSEAERVAIFLGYLNEMHYVSAIQCETSEMKNKFKNVKSRILESKDAMTVRLEKKREYRELKVLGETPEDREGRLAKERKLKKIKRTLVSSYTRE